MALYVKIIVALSVVLGGVLFHIYDKNKAVEKAVEASRIVLIAEYDKKLRDKELQAQEAERSFNERFVASLQNKDAEYSKIIANRDALISSLRKRASRAEASANSAKNSVHREACTGRELYREDGEFLAREAARAERILEERNFYYDQYEQVRQMLERLRNE